MGAAHEVHVVFVIVVVIVVSPVEQISTYVATYLSVIFFEAILSAQGEAY